MLLTGVIDDSSYLFGFRDFEIVNDVHDRRLTNENLASRPKINAGFYKLNHRYLTNSSNLLLFSQDLPGTACIHRGI